MLRARGFKVVHYNTVGYKDDPYVKLRGGAIPALMHLLLRTDHDIYFTSLGFVPSFWLYINKRLRKKRYVYNATGVKWETFSDRSTNKPFSTFLQHDAYPFLLDCTFAGASKITCNSSFLERRVGIDYPQYRDRLLTIHNGIEFELYSAGRRQQLPGARDGDLVLLCVTSLNFQNKSTGLEVILDSFGHVWERRSDARLVIAAKTSNPLCQRRVETYLDSKRWRDSVTILYNHQNIPDLLASGDIFMYATPENSNDSLPRALLEAQSAGLPVVTTNTSGCPEIVEDEKTGFVVPYDAGPMAEKILQLMENSRLREEMGRQAKKRMMRTFNWDQMADKYASLFLELAG
jgi:glycosyltransferase involved in cell wall biosynthesis